MNRRSFLVGAGAGLIVAPAIVRAASLMPVRGIVMRVGSDTVWAWPVEPLPVLYWDRYRHTLEWAQTELNRIMALRLERLSPATNP